MIDETYIDIVSTSLFAINNIKNATILVPGYPCTRLVPELGKPGTRAPWPKTGAGINKTWARENFLNQAGRG